MKGTSPSSHGGRVGEKDVSGRGNSRGTGREAGPVLACTRGSTENPCIWHGAEGATGSTGGAGVRVVGRGLNPENPPDQACSPTREVSAAGAHFADR